MVLKVGLNDCMFGAINLLLCLSEKLICQLVVCFDD